MVHRKIEDRKRVLIIFGTRPEGIKMAPLVQEFQKHADIFDTQVCVTAQHRDLLDQVLVFFNIVPDYDLDLMTAGQELAGLSAAILEGLQPILTDFKPHHVFVHGDTTTSMMAALAAFYARCQIFHVEAGLRTFDRNSPFPEEINRQLTGRLADYHFAPTSTSRNNLLKEGVSAEKILVTGNTVIDALLQTVERVRQQPSKTMLDLSGRLGDRELLLVTGHRRENHGTGFEQICLALKTLAVQRPQLVIVYPVHPNPKVLLPVKKALGGLENILLIDPVSYPDFIWLMDRAKLILTDSGGVQEEAPSLGKPVLLMRNTTERPEAVDAGTVILVGSDREKIISEVLTLLDDPKIYQEKSRLHNPYGDGQACGRIVEFVVNNPPLAPPMEGG